MEINRLCPHCMKETAGEKGKVCTYCGHRFDDRKEIQHQLKPFTILAGKYLVGDVLGEGGFGITYIGFDLNLEIRIAIKEFYPNGFAMREANVTNELTAYTGQSMDVVYKWRDNFLKEARSLAKCAHLPGVVGVRDFFQENNTAYIVQEYIEGMTLKDYMQSEGGKIAPQQLLPSLEPVLKALSQVHREGIIHRDISPDNIMIMEDGQMKLLDFGAARDFGQEGEKSLSVLLKPGYAPEEQYRTKGKQGPWTDIYAFAGTVYKCLTGVTPPESMERMRKDELKSLSELGAAVEPHIEQALRKAMAVYAEDRYQNVEEFYRELYGGEGEVTVTSSQTGAAFLGGQTDTAVSDGQTDTAGRPNVQTGQSGNGAVTGNRKKYLAAAAVGAALIAAVLFGKNAAKTSGSGHQAAMRTASDVKSSINEPEQMAVGQEAGQGQETLEQAEQGQEALEQAEQGQEALEQAEQERLEQAEQEKEAREQAQREKEAREKAAAEKEKEEENKIHRYDLVEADVTWKQAYQKCLDKGGYLARINTQKEFDAITNQIFREEKKNMIFWVGAKRRSSNDAYGWVNEDGTFTERIDTGKYADFWLSGEPSYSGTDQNGNLTDENCVDLIYLEADQRFYLNDVPNDIIKAASFYAGRVGYICEYED